MGSSTTPIEHRQWRAPRENRSALVEPSFSEIPGLLEENVALRGQRDYDFQGRRLSAMCAQARRELLREARRWTLTYRDLPPRNGQPEMILLAGHQPQLFHPGVWFKNFALGHLARQHGAVAVNLLIDSDTIKTAALRVPGGSPDDPRAVSTAFDLPGIPIPYEERRILDCGLWADFGRRVVEELTPLVSDPLIRRYWPMVVDRSRQNDNLGACLAQSRHQLEGQWGSTTLEVPQSRICQSESFAWLVAHLLAQLPRFRQSYNQSVREYRHANGIRNAAHPVPELTADGPWLESPFWIWTAKDPTRRPLMARQRGGEVLISDRQHLELALPLGPEADAARAVGRLLELSGRGVKIRSRALITTLWARLVLGDLFIHGIGGAKYDQVTDLLVGRFFGLKPPRFVVLSGTLCLPVSRPEVSADDRQRIARRLRELTYHPERSVDPASREGNGSDPGALVAAKKRWIETPQTADNARTRYREIHRINEALQPWVAAERQRLMQRRQQVEHLLRADQILSWREYGYCLYPENVLREFFAGLLPRTE